MDIRFIYFDVANTLLGKPGLFPAIAQTLQKHGYSIDPKIIAWRHKLLSESIKFPDKTSADFYASFNKELLFALGVIPNTTLLENIFSACTYLPWEPFTDVDALQKIRLPKGILSNWDQSLEIKITEHMRDISFNPILGSANLGVAKPNQLFFLKAIEASGYDPGEILFIGDSLKLDIAPAAACGMHTLLIDRENLYPAFKNRINSFNELQSVLA